MHGTLYTKRLDFDGKTYFFDVKETKTGEKYVWIIETKLKNGERIRKDVTVLDRHLGEFCECLVDLVDKLVKPN